MIALLWLLALLLPHPAQAAEVRAITFPVIGSVSYTDDFGAPRSGHTHEGNDLLGQKLLPLVAAVDGTVRYVSWPEPDYGYYVSITDSDGYQYVYIHINNDTPGTDDDLGGGRGAYAPYITSGNPVKAGQLIGWMGDSGNAENTTPHLHFEIRTPDGTAFSPYGSLQAAEHISTPVIPGAIGDELLPYGEFTGGASIALGNMDTDAALELVTGAGPGGGPQVRIFNRRGRALGGWFAYGEDFHGGIDVAAQPVTSTTAARIVTAAGLGGGPQIRVFSKTGRAKASWFAYAEDFHGGVKVAVADNKITTVPANNGGPDVRLFSIDGNFTNSITALEDWWTGGYTIANAGDIWWIASGYGGRRASLHPIVFND